MWMCLCACVLECLCAYVSMRMYADDMLLECGLQLGQPDTLHLAVGDFQINVAYFLGRRDEKIKASRM